MVKIISRNLAGGWIVEFHVNKKKVYFLGHPTDSPHEVWKKKQYNHKTIEVATSMARILWEDLIDNEFYLIR